MHLCLLLRALVMPQLHDLKASQIVSWAGCFRDWRAVPCTRREGLLPFELQLQYMVLQVRDTARQRVGRARAYTEEALKKGPSGPEAAGLRVGSNRPNFEKRA